MAKTLINIEELVPGMYIDEIVCGMRERNRLGETKNFIIETQNEISLIAKEGIKTLYIDPDKSRKYNDEVDDARSKAELTRLKSEIAPEPKSLEDELYEARTILRKVSAALANVIDDVRSGEKIQTEPLKPLLEEIFNSVSANKDAIVTICRKKSKDGYALEHAVSHSALMMAFGLTMGMDRGVLLDLGLGSLFIDIGNTRIPNSILKKPGKLNPEELEIVKKHTLFGAEIMIDSGSFPEKAISIVMEHHERYDGTGYPYQLTGDEISIAGQMASIADVYDASISIRPYGVVGDPCQVIRNLYQGAGKLFHMDMVQKFIKTIGIYPVGTLVRLESDKLGIVIKQTKNLTQPIVRIVYDLRHNCYLPPKDTDLSRVSGRGDKVVEAESPEKWKIDPFRFIFPELANT